MRNEAEHYQCLTQSQFLALMAHTGQAGSSDDAASLHCYCRLCPCTVHGGSPPACGRGSSASV